MEEFLRNPEKFQITCIPQCVYYIPNFITENEESFILSQVYSAPRPKWTQLLNRRLQNWGGIPHAKGMIAEEIPRWLQTYLDRIHNLNVMKGKSPNHALINEYLPGQGIMPHVDGSLFYPTITTITCGSHAVIHFKKNDHINDNSTLHSLLLERRSLLIVQKDLYENYLHFIEGIYEDLITDTIANIKMCSKPYFNDESLKRQTRISLTIRHVPKTTKIKIKF